MADIIPLSLPFNTAILTGRVAESSMKMYERDFKAYLLYAQTPEIAMQASTLARWRTQLSINTDLSPNTINRMMSAVKRLIKEAEEQRYVPKGTYEDFRHIDGVSVTAMKERTKPDNRRRIEPSDMRSLVSLPDPLTLVGLRDTALLHTLASSGLRVNELATLKTTQIAVSGGKYHLWVRGKNDKDFRIAHLSTEAYTAIQEWLAARPLSSDYLFTGFAGKGERANETPLTSASIWRIVKAYAEELGLERIKPHDFRRFVGTQLAKTSPREAQKALGHKKIGTTMDNYVLDDPELGITENLY